jgi:hypothetical protein
LYVDVDLPIGTPTVSNCFSLFQNCFSAVSELFQSPEAPHARKSSDRNRRTHTMKHQHFTKIAVRMAVLCATAFALVGRSQAAPDEVISKLIINRPAHQLTRTLDSVDARINVDPTESVSINVALASDNGRVRLEAPNGGAINGRGGVVEHEPLTQGRNLNFNFQVGTNPGRYTLEISQGNHTRTLEFWAGPEPPQGKPGPNLTFTSNH